MIEMNEDGYPEGAAKCPRCDTLAVVRMDGRDICLSCGATASDEKGQATDDRNTANN